MGPHPPCSHCAPLSLQPPDFSPILTDNHVALRVCSEVGLMRSPLCWAPRRDSHSAFRCCTAPPPNPCFSLPLSPMGSSQQLPMSAPYEHQGPSFFPLFFKLKFRLVCNYIVKKACMQPNNRTTANNHKQYQYSAFFPPPKNKEGFPPSGATSRWVTPLRRSRVPSSNTVLMRPSPHPPTHTFVWQLLSFNFSYLFKKKPPTVRKKNLQRVWNWTFQLPHLRKKKKNQKQKRWPRFALLSNCVTGAVRNINNEQNKFRKEEGEKHPLDFWGQMCNFADFPGHRLAPRDILVYTRRTLPFWTVWRVSDDKGSKCSPCSSVCLCADIDGVDVE